MVKTHEKKLKIIVFDFDETLYYHPRALEFYVEFIKNAICSLSSRNGDEAMKIIREYGFDRRGEKRVSFGKTCGKFGIDEKAWDEYKLSHFFEVDYDGADTVDNKLLIELAKKYTLVILSNELYENIIYKSERLEIDLSVLRTGDIPWIKRSRLKRFAKITARSLTNSLRWVTVIRWTLRRSSNSAVRACRYLQWLTPRTLLKRN